MTDPRIERVMELVDACCVESHSFIPERLKAAQNALRAELEALTDWGEPEAWKVERYGCETWCTHIEPLAKGYGEWNITPLYARKP
jgi:hypothetical protein